MCVLSDSVVSDSLQLWIIGSLLCSGSRQEYWSGLPFPPPGYRPDPGIQRCLLHWQADSFITEPSGKPKSWTEFRNYLFQIIHIALIIPRLRGLPLLFSSWLGELGSSWAGAGLAASLPLIPARLTKGFHPSHLAQASGQTVG